MWLARPVATVPWMEDRHYVCETCGLKWFVPASRAHETGARRCGECDSVLTPRDELFSGDEFLAPEQPTY